MEVSLNRFPHVNVNSYLRGKIDNWLKVITFLCKETA